MTYFSVIIPCYNKEKYIEKTLESVLKQTFKDYEIIIVDDGSTDKSLEIIKKYKKHNLTIISKKNGGVSSARNIGIENANGKFISFLDADDLWSKDYLKLVYNLTQNYPNFGLYCLKYSRMNNHKIKEANFYNIPKENNKIYLITDYFKRCALGDNISWTSAVTVPRNLFNSGIKFPTHVNRGEDRHVWSKIALNNDVILLNKVGSYYNVGSGGLTSIPDTNLNWIFENYFTRLQPSEINYRPLKHIKLYIQSRKLNFLLPLYKNKEYKRLISILVNSLRYLSLYQRIILNIIDIIRWRFTI